MDLAFHSRVVRKLFHNYKHQLHNIMKYQLTLQKELNLKYQQEKQFKQQIAKLEEDLKAALIRPSEETKKNDMGFNFRDEEEIRQEKIVEFKKAQQKIEKEIKEMDSKDNDKTVQDLKSFLEKDFTTEDTTKMRSELAMLLRQLEKERERNKYSDPNSPNFNSSLKNARASNAANRPIMTTVGIMVAVY